LSGKEVIPNVFCYILVFIPQIIFIFKVREENPHLVMGQISVARKMGFPEVILPGDVRNDLYLTLVSGDFSKGSKTTDKNVQVSVTVCNEKGQVLQVSWIYPTSSNS
jgi:hypothetical protein